MIALPIERCRGCGNSHLVPVCSLGTMALTGFFPETPQQTVPEGPLELVKCCGGGDSCCGLVQLKHSFAPETLFGGNYGYRSGLNESIRRHLQGIARQIAELANLSPGDVILDVGSNDGTLLNFFAGRELVLLGVDPSARQFRRYYAEGVLAAPEFFSGAVVRKELGTRKVKAVAAVSVFYDFDSPEQFLTEIRDLLSDDGICLLEQSYWPSVVKNNAYDAICHEHAAYYGLRQIQWLAQRTGFKIAHCELTSMNGGSLRVILVKRNSIFPEASGRIEQMLRQEEHLALDTLSLYGAFRDNIVRHREELLQAIAGLRADGRRTAGYGASTKGNVLLQFCGLTVRDIPFIAEVNEEKWGRFSPGTRIPIISEDEARLKNPDVFLVLPWHLREGFILKEKEYLERGGTLLFPLPRIEKVAHSSRRPLAGTVV